MPASTQVSPKFTTVIDIGAAIREREPNHGHIVSWATLTGVIRSAMDPKTHSQSQKCLVNAASARPGFAVATLLSAHL